MKPLGFSSMPWGFILGLKLLCMHTRTHTHWKAHRQHYPSQVFHHAASLLNSKHGIKLLSPLSILSFKPRNKTKQFCHLSICVICVWADIVCLLLDFPSNVFIKLVIYLIFHHYTFHQSEYVLWTCYGVSVKRAWNKLAPMTPKSKRVMFFRFDKSKKESTSSHILKANKTMWIAKIKPFFLERFCSNHNR